MKASDVEAARLHLMARQDELQRLSQDSSGARGPVELDQQSVGRLSRMDALQQQAMAQAQQRARSAELVRIDQALRRIADGEYGWCVSCGEKIAPGRLAADPSTAQCVGCAGGR